MADITYTYLVTYHNGHTEKKEAKGYREDDGNYVWTLADGSESRELKAPVKSIVPTSFTPFDPAE